MLSIDKFTFHNLFSADNISLNLDNLFSIEKFTTHDLDNLLSIDKLNSNICFNVTSFALSIWARQNKQLYRCNRNEFISPTEKTSKSKNIERERGENGVKLNTGVVLY